MMRSVPISAALLACVLFQAPPALAQDAPVQLRFSHWVPVAHPMHAAAASWAESIEKVSNGSIKIVIFPAQHSEKRSITTIWHAMPSPTSRTSTRVTSRAAFRSSRRSNCPSCFSNAREGSAALDAWYRRYADREMKDVRYCLAFAHDPGSFHFTRKKVVVPADVAGLKVRPPNAVIASWMRQLGRSAFRPPLRKSATCWRKG
jgi:TRAP-type C4-dicarboxylate transport system substrate-binding protein